MDLHLASLRDRRVAASDEFRSTQRSQETGELLPIYGRGSAARTGGSRSARRFDRQPDEIHTVILHQTTGPVFVDLPPAHRNHLPDPSTDGDVANDHRLDRIIAHFVILQNGLVFYAHDLQYVLNDAGGRYGIDVEFAGRFPCSPRPGTPRLDRKAILAGRELVRYLRLVLPNLRNIHPHGQVQLPNRQGRVGKLDSCPGPDIWVNVGEWAVRTLHMICDPPAGNYPNNGISTAQRNWAYDQRIP